MSLSKGTSAFDCPINFIRLPWSILMGFKFFTHVCNCSVKTELIGKNNYAKKSQLLDDPQQNVSTIFRVLCFWDFSRTVELLHGKSDTRFLRIPIASCPRYDPKFLVDYSLPKNTTSFRNLDQWMTIVQYQISLQVWRRLWHLPYILLHCLFPSQEMSLNTNIKRILPGKISGVSPNLLCRSVTLPQSCNVVNPGKIFHSNSVGSPLIPS